MRANTIRTFYHPKMVLQDDHDDNVSKSPLKPKLLLEYLEHQGLLSYFPIDDTFESLTRKDFLIAHLPNYVEAMFNGIKPLCESSGLKWSKQFLESITYTNASLYAAIKHSIDYPQQVCFSPTSGYHHATPDRGNAFCTFSGQVIASMKIYQEYGLSGAYLDLDAHYGNSIQDSYYYVKDLDKAIPYGCNINPDHKGRTYINALKHRLAILEERILANEIHYVVFAHGADSQKDDDMGGQFTTQQWVQCSRIVYEWVTQLDNKLQRPLPLTLCLFGGYRSDDFRSVLSLHTADLVSCLNHLTKLHIKYKPFVTSKLII